MIFLPSYKHSRITTAHPLVLFPCTAPSTSLSSWPTTLPSSPSAYSPTATVLLLSPLPIQTRFISFASRPFQPVHFPNLQTSLPPRRVFAPVPSSRTRSPARQRRPPSFARSFLLTLLRTKVGRHIVPTSFCPHSTQIWPQHAHHVL